MLPMVHLGNRCLQRERRNHAEHDRFLRGEGGQSARPPSLGSSCPAINGRHLGRVFQIEHGEVSTVEAEENVIKAEAILRRGASRGVVEIWAPAESACRARYLQAVGLDEAALRAVQDSPAGRDLQWRGCPAAVV